MTAVLPMPTTVSPARGSASATRTVPIGPQVFSSGLMPRTGASQRAREWVYAKRIDLVKPGFEGGIEFTPTVSRGQRRPPGRPVSLTRSGCLYIAWRAKWREVIRLDGVRSTQSMPSQTIVPVSNSNR